MTDSLYSDLDALPFATDTPATPNVTTKRRHRHVWGVAMTWIGMGYQPVNVGPDGRLVNLTDEVCCYCWRHKDPAASRRGRTSLRAGKDAERAIAKSYGGTRTGQYGGPDDVLVGELFVVQSKAGGWFSNRYWDELAKLPRTGGRIPTLIVSDRPGPGHRTRRLVVRTLDDDLALHGPKA